MKDAKNNKVQAGEPIKPSPFALPLNITSPKKLAFSKSPKTIIALVIAIICIIILLTSLYVRSNKNEPATGNNNEVTAFVDPEPQFIESNRPPPGSEAAIYLESIETRLANSAELSDEEKAKLYHEAMLTYATFELVEAQRYAQLIVDSSGEELEKQFLDALTLIVEGKYKEGLAAYDAIEFTVTDNDHE